MTGWRVKYKSPTGSRCPDAIVVTALPDTELTPEVVSKIHDALIRLRGGWEHVKIESIEYVGPAFAAHDTKLR